MRLDTGGGKTVILSALVSEHAGASAVIAHRQELVSQLSLALARNGVRHNIIAPTAVKRAIVAEHVDRVGTSWFDPNARTAVVSVDTLAARRDRLAHWAAGVTLWIVDEGHHLVVDNKWHTAVGMFTHPACVGLEPTATPQRADGKGLGRGQGGVADVMVQGPPMRWLIEQGYLCDYDIVCPESDMQLLESEISAGGDWSTAKLRAAAKASHIVGDVVSSYRRWALGKLWITFCPDTETAAEITQAYNDAGIPAGLLTGKTHDGVRRQLLRQFEHRQILQLVVVDVVSEGFDLPAVEGCSFARKTASLATYMQQFGRTLRPMPGKPRALIIDHVGNFIRHGPPDRPREWSLSKREGRKGSSGPQMHRVCLGCWRPYERFRKACPFCGQAAPPPIGRDSPAMVDGVMNLLSPELLAKLRGDLDAVDMEPEAYRQQLAAKNMPVVGQLANVKRHVARQAAQRELREAMGRPGGVWRSRGLDDGEMQAAFYLTFGVDVLTAQTLGTDEATALTQRLREWTP